MIASGIPTMRGHCKAQKICTARVDCFHAQEGLVESLTKCALSLRFGNAMKHFRAAWRTVAFHKMVVERVRTPSILDKRQNEEFLNAVAPRNKPFGHLDKIHLLTTCEGLWLDRSKIEVFVKQNDRRTDLQIKRDKVMVMQKAAVKRIGSFPSRNWIKADEAPCIVAVWDGLHGMFGPTYKLMCDTLNAKREAAEKREAAQQRRRQPEPPAARAPPAPPPAPPAPPQPGGMEGNIDLAIVAAAVGPNLGVDKAKEGGRAQHRFRTATVAWIESGMQGVLAQLVVLRIVIEVHVNWMAACLYKAGEKWAHRERMVGLERTLESLPGSGGQGEGPQRRRRYRVEDSYNAREEETVMDKAEVLMTSTTCWKAVPRSQRCSSLEILATKELVKTAARAHKLKSDAQNYPVKLAATPWRPDLILVVNEDAKCPKRLCPWSRAVMTWFNNDAGSLACRAHLVATNVAARDENVGIESKFSRIRRFVIGKSVQQKRVDMCGLQQYWIGLTTRVSWIFNTAYNNIYGGPEKSAPPPKKKRQKRTREKAYDPFAAYMREQKKGVPRSMWPTMDVMHATFDSFSDEDKAPYVRAAAHATVRRQQGDPNPWGDPPPAPTARAMAVAPIARGETVHIAQYDTEEVVRWIPAIKGARWRDTRAATQKNEEETERLISFNKPDGAGAAVVGAINRELPQRSGRECGIDGLYMEPLGFRSAAFTHFQYDFHLAEHAAHQLLRLETRGGGRGGSARPLAAVFQALRKLWRRINTTIQHFACPEIKFAPMPPESTRTCHIANRCLCTDFGKKISKVHASLLDAVAHQFPRGPRGRAPVRSGNAVALFVEEREPATPWAFMHLSDVKEAMAGEGWVINLVEFEAASLESETLVKEMVTAARAPAGEPVPELRAEDETLISIKAMLPLRNHVYTSWDLAQRIALSSPMVLQWCEVVDDGKLLGELCPHTFKIRFANAPVFALWGSINWRAPEEPAPIEAEPGDPAPRQPLHPPQPIYDDEDTIVDDDDSSSKSGSGDSSGDDSSRSGSNGSSSGGSAPPVHPPAAAAAGAAAKAAPAPAPGAGVQRPWGELKNPTVTVNLGADLGFLDYEDGKMCAVCTQHDANYLGKPCMRVRQVQRGNKRMRPAGPLTEWVRAGQQFPDRGARAEHMNKELRDLELDRCADARNFLETRPNGTDFTAKE